MASSRETVLDMLVRMDTSGAYSNILLDNTLSRDQVTPRDKAFATALFYGVLERRMTLDYIIREYSSVQFDKIEGKVLQILRMGLYQLLYMDSVPDNAAVNESVKLAGSSASGYVNAILRSFVRASKKIDTSRLEDEAKLSIEYSCPKWIVKQWTKAYGEDIATKILESSFGRPPLYVKVNTSRINADELIKEFRRDKIEAKRNALLPDCLEIGKLETGKSIEETNVFRKGYFHVQDISSQLCCKIISPVFNQTIIDLCAAPGGKTFTIAEALCNRGTLISCDMYDGKLSQIDEGAKRLGLSLITTKLNDATAYDPDLPLADRVVCDVPCSGLGIIRRKPEIKYKPMKSLEDLPQVQKSIIDVAARYVKVGGTLIYSTCTLNPLENEAVVDYFLSGHPEFSPVIVSLNIRGIADTAVRNFFPHITGGDGFFVATFRRTR